MPARMTSVCFAPGPSGTACRRTSAGSSTTSTSGSSRWCSSAPTIPAGAACRRRRAPSRRSALRPCAARRATTRSPLSVTMPGNTVSPISPDRGGTTTSATPDCAADERRPGSSSKRVLLDERRAKSLKSRFMARGFRVGGSRSPKRTTIAIVPASSGMPDERELEEPEPPHPRVSRVPGDDDVDRRPGEGEQRPGMSSERERHEDLGRRHVEADGHHGDDGQKRGDGAVHADQRCEHGHEQHHQDDQSRAAVSRAGNQLLPGPGGDARRVEPFADDEQRRDEDHRRVAEAGERLLEVEDARSPRARERPRTATTPTGSWSHTNDDHHGREDRGR